MLEGSESFNLIISSSFVAQEIIVGNPGVVTVTIMDDEGESDCCWLSSYLASYLQISYVVLRFDYW